ncbi:MAG: DUF3226 domain-containing protein [Nitrosomonas ureae]
MATNQISKEKLLLVEGNDEVTVLSLLLDTIGITDIQIIDCGGNIQFKSKFPVLIKSPEFSDVTAYAIIQDADSNAPGAFESIQYQLSKHLQPTPVSVETFVEKNGVRVGVFVLPGAGLPGMLEDLYLKTLEGTPVLECVDSCVDEISKRCPPSTVKGIFGLPTQRLAKARALGTLMATSAPHNRLGHAAKDGYWNFSHGAMQPLIEFLRLL